jgi:hypothetical protein
MKYIALTGLLLGSLPAFATPITFSVKFSLEICDRQADGTADCTFSNYPAETVELDSDGFHPVSWSKKITKGEHDFTGQIAVARQSDGDRVVFRITTSPHHQARMPAYLSFKLWDWRQLQQFTFEPEPYVEGNREYHPKLAVTSAL